MHSLTERHEKIIKHLGLVYWVARRFQHRGMELDDLVQTGSVALCEAVDRFDAARNFKFSTYAAKLIRYKLLDELNHRSLVHVPRNKLRAGYRVPEFKDIAGDERELTRYDSEPNEPQDFERVNHSIERLPERTRSIIRQQAAGKTLDEIGRQYGLTRQRISQIARGAREQLSTLCRSA